VSRPVFLASSDAFEVDEIVLDGSEGRHAATVRRIEVGEEIDLTDGSGTIATCVVTRADKASLTVAVHDRRAIPAPSPRLVVAQAIPKGDRGETAVETLTEVGVDEIVPWAAQRAMVRWKGDRRDKQLARWRSTAREAAKQARRAWVPAISDPVETPELVSRAGAADSAVVLHEGAATTSPLTEVPAPEVGEILLVVGPEGGVSPDELSAFDDIGARQASLGPTVLRTSTAGTVAAGIVLSRTERWSTPPV